MPQLYYCVLLIIAALSNIEGKEEKGYCDIMDESNKESCHKEEEEHISTKPISSQQTQEEPTPTTTTQEEQPTTTEEHPTAGTTITEEAGATSKPAKTKVDTKKKTKEKQYTFPTNLDEFGYHFTNDGRLRSIESDEPFQFEVQKDDKTYNQKHYDALGQAITRYIYQLLETETHLIKHTVPVNPKKDEPTSFFFGSEDAFTNTHKLMIIIHGSGAVRAGQWARRLIINDCLDSGTQLPFIKRAIKEGYGVVVLNGNRNYEEDNEKKKPIRGSFTPEEHGIYVWKNFILKAPAKKVHIIAHSHGGVVTVEIMKEFLSDFRNRVDKIAFTDSVHMLDGQHVSAPAKRYISNVAKNWVSSKDPLDTHQPSLHERNTVSRVSAGTDKHVETSWCSFDSVFKHFNTP